MKFFSHKRIYPIHNTLCTARKGFTLVEMLVAVLIFSLALVALMTIASRGIASNKVVADEIAAQYLVAEGVEVVRQIRDSNYLAGQYWLDNGLDQCDDGCFVEFDENTAPFFTLQQCASNPCSDPLLFNAGDMIINVALGGSVVTDFTRTIYIEQRTADEVRVDSQVIWQQGRLERVITMTEYLRDWQNI